MKNNLPTLSILHYVYGGLVCFFGLLALLMVGMGHWFSSDWFLRHADEAPPRFLGHLFILLGWVIFVFAEAKGVLNIISGSMIKRRRNRLFSQIVAGVNCLNIPVGIALGIFTFVTLNHDEVKRDYEAVGLDVR